MAQVILNDVRTAFPVFVKPEAFRPGDPERFSGVFLIPKDSPQATTIKQAMLETLKDKYKDKAKEVLARLISKDQTCLRDGDESKYETFHGHYEVRANTKKEYPPTLVNEQAKPMTDDEATRKFYSGCYVTAIIEIGLSPATPGYVERVNAYLGGVQFRKDGDALGGARVSAAAFKPVAPVDAFGVEDASVGTEVIEDSEAFGLDDLV